MHGRERRKKRFFFTADGSHSLTDTNYSFFPEHCAHYHVRCTMPSSVQSVRVSNCLCRSSSPPGRHSVPVKPLYTQAAATSSYQFVAAGLKPSHAGLVCIGLAWMIYTLRSLIARPLPNTFEVIDSERRKSQKDT